MGKYLHEITLNRNNIPKKTALLEELLLLIKKDRELDIEVLKEFPPKNLMGSNDIWVEGSKLLIQSFLEIDNEKLDIVDKLANIEIKGINPKGQFSLMLLQDDIYAEGIYRFTHEFLEMLFQMGKFSNYCIEKQWDNILLDTVHKLFNQTPDKSLQLRLIQDGEKWLIRGVISTRYRNYDNHLALYLTLYTLHQNAKLTGQWFMLEKAYLSDSEIVVIFDQVTPVHIVDIGKLYFGIVLINNEIKEKSFTLEWRFQLEDDEGNKFGAIPPEGKATIFNIRHSSSINHVNKSLLELHELQYFKERITNFIMSLSAGPYLSEDRIYSIFNRILNTRNKFSKETKDSFKKLHKTEIISNSMHIIKAFHRLNELVTDVEEKIHLERILYEVCLDLSGRKAKI
ncbi:hypothetical protein [Oceanobacillus bengalensis]|uniref:Uncharacterized protein n=1 Tax=Oceanobacillus bengalensis TaxID=1435466 RepID=A0A494YT14_9BACI|nr:hypothetical protein [Oceanobacillus bengalensis]RKQ13214.1 hypothetical protein D8M05_17095 [Oceanobacillus bengalensis]